MSLSSENLGSFESALRHLPQELAADGARAEPIIKAALDTIAHSNLPDEERSRRARRLADVLGTDSTSSDALLGAVRSAAPEVRAGVLAALSPDRRARVYRHADSNVADQEGPREPTVVVVVATCSGPGVDVGMPVNVATDERLDRSRVAGLP